MVWPLFITCIFILLTNDIYIQAKKCEFCTKCRCKFIKKTLMYNANCHNSNLNSLPYFPNSIQLIDASNNNILKIHDFSFQKNSRLKKLILSHNKINTLSRNSLTGLIELVYLKLDNNNISTIKYDTFCQLTKLAFLDFKKNKINIWTINFQCINCLTSLSMDFIATQNMSIPTGPRSLRNLDVSGLSGNCKANILTNETFKYVPTITNITLSGCKINYIYQGTFSFLTNLAALDVSYNMCLHFDGVENITNDLPTTSIKILKLNKIHQTFGMNTRIMRSHLRNLKRTNLTEIHADSNRIRLIEKGAIPLLPYTIRHVSMRDNEFSYGSYLYDVVAAPVESVDFSFLFDSHSPDEKEEKCVSNHMERKFTAVNEEDFTSFNSSISNFNSIPIFPIPMKLKKLVYSQCHLRYEIPRMRITNNSIEHLDGSYNLFYSWIGPLLHLDHVKFLNISNNFCSNVSKVFFHSTPNVEILDVQNNLLGFVLPDDKYGDILQRLSKIKVINLNNNRIPSLPFMFFKSQNLIRKLYLKGNMLQEISFSILHMSKLKLFDLSKNRITSLNSRNRDDLDKIASRQTDNLWIDLSDNPLKCTCTTKDFIHWMSFTAVKFLKLQKYECELSNGETATLRHPKVVYQKLQKECSSYGTLILGIAAAIVFFLSLLIGGLVYRNRWKLRYMYYMIKSKHRDQGCKLRSLNEGTYMYDVFISYDDNDQTFVRDKLLKRLEREAGLQLCIHKRDFLPGNDIAENIIHAIHNSRKVVVIMSRSFLESYWCMYEYNMAKVESIYSRNKENILFLVFLEQLSARELPLTVLELVQSQSYIEYPNDEYGDEIFWKNLQKALE